MLRRLFFLFPDEPNAQSAVDKLIELDIPLQRIHVLARNIKLKTLPKATLRNKSDTVFHIEPLLWVTNLTLFMLALISFVVALVIGELLWAGISLALMAASFIAGEKLVVYIPYVHLSEFNVALSHGEILLMIDVQANRVAEIEGFVHHKYPEANIGGDSSTMEVSDS